MKIISDNRKARHNYELLDKFEAGLVLRGSEVKSLRAGHINLKDSFIAFRKGEAFLQNAHISPYEASSYNNHEPERLRKLLLNRREIERIDGQVREKSYSCVPTKIYFKKGRVKIEIALARGKKQFDKREALKRRQVDRELQRQLRRSK